MISPRRLLSSYLFSPPISFSRYCLHDRPIRYNLFVNDFVDDVIEGRPKESARMTLVEAISECSGPAESPGMILRVIARNKQVEERTR
jgi:hypothetical protein